MLLVNYPIVRSYSFHEHLCHAKFSPSADMTPLEWTVVIKNFVKINCHKVAKLS